MPRVMTSLLMSSLPISTLHRLFDADCRIPGTWLQALLPFPTPPQEGAGETAINWLNTCFRYLWTYLPKHGPLNQHYNKIL